MDDTQTQHHFSPSHPETESALQSDGTGIAGEAVPEEQSPAGKRSLLSPRQPEDGLACEETEKRSYVTAPLHLPPTPIPATDRSLVDLLLHVGAEESIGEDLPQITSASRLQTALGGIRKIPSWIMGILAMLAMLLLMVILFHARAASGSSEDKSPVPGKQQVSARANDGSLGQADSLVRFIEQSLQSNVITSSGNPLLSDTERMAVISQALRTIQDPEIREGHLKDHQTLFAGMKAKGLDKELWYQHIATCRDVCLPAFSSLVKAHQEKVTQLVHQAVFFGLGKSDLNSVGRRDLLNISNVTASPPFAGKQILLIARASKVGAHEPNMALSERRVRAVQEELVRLGLSRDRIQPFWLGWEQPYLSKDVAAAYAIPEGLYGGDDIRLNQSVMVIVY